ncbi:MAG: hypothetical protein ACOX78_09500 [Lachnospiraceae bacterium]
MKTRIYNGEAGRHEPRTLNLFSASSIIILVVGIFLFIISPGLVLIALIPFFAVIRNQIKGQAGKEDDFRQQIWNNVLGVVFPGARLNDDIHVSDADRDRIYSVLPESEHLFLNDNCALHDELDTHIYQLYGYDEYRDDDGHFHEQTRFSGLVLHAHIPTGMSGNDILKVVRTNKFLGKEFHSGQKMKELERFETEDIVFNANYDAYCDPGNVAARVLLGPAAIVQLDNWVKKHPVNMMADADTILISFDMRKDLNGLFSHVHVSGGGTLKSRNAYLEDNFYETLRGTLEEPLCVLSAVVEQIVKN